MQLHCKNVGFCAVARAALYMRRTVQTGLLEICVLQRLRTAQQQA